MKEKLHDSWLRLVYGPKRRKFRRRERLPRPTDPVERMQVKLPYRRKYFHRRQPTITVTRRATRHDR